MFRASHSAWPLELGNLSVAHPLTGQVEGPRDVFQGKTAEAVALLNLVSEIMQHHSHTF